MGADGVEPGEDTLSYEEMLRWQKVGAGDEESPSKARPAADEGGAPWDAAPGDPRPSHVALDAEQSVLGAIMRDPKWWEPVSRLLVATDFGDAGHREIWRGIEQIMFAQEIPEPIGLAQQLQIEGTLEAAGGMAYLFMLAREVLADDQAPSYAKSVLRQSRQRQIAQIMRDTQAEADGGARVEELLESLTERLDPLRVDVAAGRVAKYPSLLVFSPESLMGAIDPERYLLPGIPEAAYSILGGAASASKTTCLCYLLLWKATGFDVLDLDPEGSGVQPGRALMVSYEESQARLDRKIRHVAQHCHARILANHGADAAAEFLRAAAFNLAGWSLHGKTGCGITRRDGRGVAPNEPFLEHLTQQLKAWAPDGVTMGLDPLRLAVVGSQNDDDGADTAVHTLNRIACCLPASGLIVVSHATKADAKAPPGGSAAAIYATAGSGLFSQHARSNFALQRLDEAAIRSTFKGGEVTDAEAIDGLVTQLTHGRDSHGTARRQVYLAMRAGALERIRPTEGGTVQGDMLAQAPQILAAMDRLHEQGMRASGEALARDPQLKVPRADLRALLTLLTQNGFIEQTGSTKDRDLRVTDKGRQLSGVNQRES